MSAMPASAYPASRLLAPALLFAALCATALAAPVRPELAASRQPLMPLEDGWANPPTIARTRVWWWWLNGNVTKEAITRDLEQMKAKGLGGANIIDAGGDNQRNHRRVPHGPDFATLAWRQLFIHALAEADRLGLELGFNIQSGWNLGGPSVKMDESTKAVAFTSVTVEGGRRVEIALPLPTLKEGFYRDVAVLAYPAAPEKAETGNTAAGAHKGKKAVSTAPSATPGTATASAAPTAKNVAEKAKSKAKAKGPAAQPVTALPRLAEKTYARYPGAFTATTAWHLLEPGADAPTDVLCSPEQVVALTGKMDAEGRLTWDAPAGRWTILRFGYTLAGSHVSTCSEGGDGWAIDYLDATAFDAYWQRVLDPIFAEAKPYLGRSLRYLHTDSWELGPVNWTARMPEEFKRRRGYDLTPYLPVFANRIVGSREQSTRFLNDFRRTLAELIADNKYRRFSERAHALGLGIHPESGGPHAAPIDALMNLGLSDVPMGEFWAPSPTHRVKPEQRFFVKQTTSAAHTYGLRLSLAEAFTSIGPQWEEDPRSLKATFDRAACEGHNLTMWHTFDCSPREMGLPGQAYFAGTHLNPNVTWWPLAGAFFDYMNRCHFLLQQGLPVSDVLHFYGENIPSFVRLKDDDPSGAYPDYDYDVVDLTVLLSRVRAGDGGRLVLPEGTSYALLSLPPHDAIGLRALRHVAGLVREGAMLVGKRPARPYGLAIKPEDDEAFQSLCDSLWGRETPTGGDAKPREVGIGRVFSGVDARTALRSAGVPRDFAWEGGDASTLIDWIHRRTDEADIYFVANRENRRETGRATFRVSGRTPELWDPVTGERRALPAYEARGGTSVVPLRFEPEQAFFIVWRADKGGAKPAPASGLGAASASAQGTKGGLGTATTAASWKSGAERNFPEPSPVHDITGPWTVRFDPAWGGPAEISFDTLTDWTRRPEEGIRHYSGTATYERTFTLPPTAAPAGGRLLLDLGELRNVAEVSLNGRRVGIVWSFPYRIDISDTLLPGANRLVVKVVNLWPNRLIGDQLLPEAARRTKTNITKYEQRDAQKLLPSGLLGPVRLLSLPRQ